MQISTVDSDALPQNNQIAWFGIKKEPLCICYTVSKSPQTSLLITPLPAPISASNFHDLTQITQRRVCFNPNRIEKPKAHGFSVRFGLKSYRFHEIRHF